MGLAERFKNKLENKNIFEKDIIEQKLEEKDIKFISKPVDSAELNTKNTAMQQAVVLPVKDILSENETSQVSPKKIIFEDIETELMAKIRRTPYWEEFSLVRQTNMIERYFDARIVAEGVEYSPRDKANFVRTALALANNR